MSRAADREPAVLLALGSVLLIASGIRPLDRLTWLLDVFPIFIAVPVLVRTARQFPLTPLVYRLVFVHALILMLGGHYSYAQIPLGFWVQDLFGLARNHFDRLGHLAEGFVPAIIAREVLLRDRRWSAGNGCSSLSYAFASRSARSTSSSNGGLRC